MGALKLDETFVRLHCRQFYQKSWAKIVFCANNNNVFVKDVRLRIDQIIEYISGQVT